MISIISSKEKEKLIALRRKLSIQEGLVTKSSSRLTEEVFGEPLSPIEVVRTILQDVKDKKDEGVFKYNKALDGNHLFGRDLLVSKDEIQEAYKTVDPFFIKAVKMAYKNIESYQKKIKYQFAKTIKNQGLSISLKITAIEKIGVYIPGGAALYPSSILMNVVPAKVAGVQSVTMVTPPSKEGKIDDHLLVVADICGVNSIYKVGGVQALAALAFGTETIDPVYKIVGPGNLFVALAKKELYGYVDIDMVAGPSEILIIADDTANPEFLAYDLMAQAEHYPGSALLFTTSKKLAVKVQSAIEKNIVSLEREDKIREDLELYSYIVVTENEQENIDLCNEMAPEHLEIVVKNSVALAKKIKNAGAIFLGNYTPVALGDYFAGPSHTLPTSGTAKFFSGVNVNDFIKTTAIIESNKKYLNQNSALIESIANVEGLVAHRASLEVRKK